MTADVTGAAIEQAMPCPLCATPGAAKRARWLWRCPSCLFLYSALQPRIIDRDSSRSMDEGLRADGLRALRERNFAVILDRLRAHRAPPADLLEVGCAHRWFLHLASRRGYQVTGLEPDPSMNAPNADVETTVIDGFFPDAVRDRRAGFDVIAFNDVFEHLPNIDEAAAACDHLLRDNGLLVVNLPNASGTIYHAANVLARLGLAGPLERLWQKDLPSPHLSYFTPSHLRALMAKHGLREIERGRLQSLTTAGLWDRIACVGGTRRPVMAVQWCLAMAVMPVLRLLPPDITFQIFRKDGAFA